MSGVNRMIKAENASAGRTGMKALAKFSPTELRKETGRTIHSDAGKQADPGEYLGKNAKPVKAK
jgi:hypothetical protein